MNLFSITGLLLPNQAGQAASRVINGGLRRWPVRKQSGVYDVSSLPRPRFLAPGNPSCPDLHSNLLY